MERCGSLSIFSGRWKTSVRCLQPWSRTAILAVFILIVRSGLAASAKDLDLLTRYLVPVFLAQHFAATCRVADPAFLFDLPRGSEIVDDFSEQLKREISSKLTEHDAATVVVVAANTALQAARDEMRKLSLAYPKLPAEALNRWCRDDARPLILKVIRADQRGHEEFLDLIRKARQ
jgi:hypothetical protein